MFSSIAYYLGFADNGSTSAVTEEKPAPSFVTEETEDHWTLVDLKIKNEGKTELSDYPTPPPSPKMEQSWLLMPPPCFNAESDVPIDELSPRENLLIEHPSLFVGQPDATKYVVAVIKEEKKPVTTAQQQRKVGTVSRSQRKAARQALQALSQQSKRNYQFKKTSSDVIRRNNKAFKNMRQRVQQPRKHY